MEKSRKIPYIFLTSHAFSGSTLTSFLIGAHPEIATVGMLTGPARHLDLKTYRCSCGQWFQEDPFWHDVAAVLNRNGLPYSRDAHFGTRIELGSSQFARRLRTNSLRSNRLEDMRDWFMFNFWPGHQQAMYELVQRNVLFAQAIMEVSGKSAFLDTSKDPMRIRYLQLSSQIDLYVIHLIRDVRGVVASIMSRRPEMDVKRATRHWLVAKKNIQRQLETLPASRQIKVRYEDIATNTLDSLNRLFAFVGVGEMTELVDYRQVEHHILGNKMRKHASSDIRLDERWRTRLTQSQLQLIERMIDVSV